MELLNPKSNKVFFWSSGKRELFPTHVPHHRFGVDCLPIRGLPNIGPNLYKADEKTSLWYQIENKICSKKGYSLGARTSARFPKTHRLKVPCPPTYQSLDPKKFSDSFKPFNVGVQRFSVKKKEKKCGNPSPNTYNVCLPRCKEVQYHQTFGGTPINMPKNTIQSTIPVNTDKLYSTKEENRYNRKLAYLKLYYD